MSDSIHSFTVVLEKDAWDGEAADIAAAIRMVKGVLSVEPQVADGSVHLAESRLAHEWFHILFDLASLAHDYRKREALGKMLRELKNKEM